MKVLVLDSWQPCFPSEGDVIETGGKFWRIIKEVRSKTFLAEEIEVVTETSPARIVGRK